MDRFDKYSYYLAMAALLEKAEEIVAQARDTFNDYFNECNEKYVFIGMDTASNAFGILKVLNGMSEYVEGYNAGVEASKEKMEQEVNDD